MEYEVFSASSKRRNEIILKIINSEWGGIYVNRKWCMNTQRDPDLKRLLNRGLVEQVREHSRIWGRSFRTKLVLTKAGREFAKRNKLI